MKNMCELQHQQNNSVKEERRIRDTAAKVSKSPTGLSRYDPSRSLKTFAHNAWRGRTEDSCFWERQSCNFTEEGKHMTWRRGDERGVFGGW